MKLAGPHVSLEDLVSEMHTIVALPDHPNIIKCYGFSRIHRPGLPTEVGIVSQFAAGGSLLDFMRTRPDHYDWLKDSVVNDAALFNILDAACTRERRNPNPSALSGRGALAKHLGRGLPASQRHRTPRPGSSEHPRRSLDLPYLGVGLLAHQVPPSSRTSAPFPVEWSAPETIMDSEFSPKSDTWSFGVCIFELLTRRMPWTRALTKARTQYNIMKAMESGVRPVLDAQTPDGVRKVTARCWQFKAADRPAMIEVKDAIGALMDQLSALNAKLTRMATV